jgi:hypothetical protein
MLRRSLLATSVLTLAAGCVYIPPMRHTAGVESVRRIEHGTATRADVIERLGRPNVLAKRDVYLYGWSRSYGYVVAGAGYTGALGELTGKHFHVVVFFDGERVARYSWDGHPPVAMEGLAAPL